MLVDGAQVLDRAGGRREAWVVNHTRIETRDDPMDPAPPGTAMIGLDRTRRGGGAAPRPPAALGTVMIGLDRIRREEEAETGDSVAEPKHRATRGHWLAVRRRVAAGLHGAARRIEPAPAGAA